MSVMAVAALVLARAEAGELGTGRGVALPASPGRAEASLKIPTSRHSRPVRDELAKWRLEEGLHHTIELLVRAKLLVQNPTGRLHPAALAYRWLQWPPSLACGLLLESSGLPLPLSEDLAGSLKRGLKIGKHTNALIRHSLTTLTTLGLTKTEEDGTYRVLPKAAILLELLASTPTGLAPEEERQLALGAEWLQYFPGASPLPGWLRWYKEEFCFGFARPVSGKPLTFDPWQLFRLLSISEPVVIAQLPSRLCCKPEQRRVVQANLRGISTAAIKSYLTEGLSGPLPTDLLNELKKWSASSQRYRVRQIILLEAQDRQALEPLLADKRLRSYFVSLLSPRHAELSLNELARFKQMMERRGWFIQPEPPLDAPRPVKGGTSLILTRRQIQELAAAAWFLRRHEVQEGQSTDFLDATIARLEESLSRREKREVAQRIAEDTPGQLEEIGPVAPSLEELNLLRTKIEASITQEAEILVEYATPGRKPQKRWLDPLYLEEQADYIYLTAYCHWRKEQRVFRLDRMKLIQTKLQHP